MLIFQCLKQLQPQKRKKHVSCFTSSTNFTTKHLLKCPSVLYLYVCVYPIPCLPVDNVSVTTMVASTPTPTTPPITSHSTTPTLLPPTLALDPEGNTHAYLSFLALLHPNGKTDNYDLQGRDHITILKFRVFFLAYLLKFIMDLLQKSFCIFKHGAKEQYNQQTIIPLSSCPHQSNSTCCCH